MKYSDMQKQLDSGRFEKRPLNTAKVAYKPAQTRGMELPLIPDLLTPLDAETWLASRLAQHGCDIYNSAEPYATYADRLGACIVRNGMQCVIVGRKDGKPESYAKCFERIAGKPLPKAVDVSRVTPHDQPQHNTGDT